MMFVTFDEPLIVTCDRCGGGRGDFVNPCDWCGATGGVPPDAVSDRPATLAHNLAIGGALCAAFALGSKYADDLWDVDAHATLWRPGCGRSKP